MQHKKFLRLTVSCRLSTENGMAVAVREALPCCCWCGCCGIAATTVSPLFTLRSWSSLLLGEPDDCLQNKTNAATFTHPTACCYRTNALCQKLTSGTRSVRKTGKNRKQLRLDQILTTVKCYDNCLRCQCKRLYVKKPSLSGGLTKLLQNLKKYSDNKLNNSFSQLPFCCKKYKKYCLHGTSNIENFLANLMQILKKDKS